MYNGWFKITFYQIHTDYVEENKHEKGIAFPSYNHENDVWLNVNTEIWCISMRNPVFMIHMIGKFYV